MTKTSQKQNDGSQKQQLRGKRVVFHGSPKTKEGSLKRPCSAGQLRRYRTQKMDDLVTNKERKRGGPQSRTSGGQSRNKVQRKKKYVVNKSISADRRGYGLDKKQISAQSFERKTALVYANATLTVDIPEDVVFSKNCNLVRSLWDELHVPNRDRRYFSRTFMLEYTDANAKFVAEQLQLLNCPRERTICALVAIRERERAIKDLDSICKAAASALIRSHAIVSGTTAAISSREVHSATNLTKMSERPPARPPVIDLTTLDSKHNHESDEIEVSVSKLQSQQIKSFRNLIIDRSRHAQLKTMDVINAIKKWRQNLWRNQPFRWRNENYILRIGNCVGLEDIVRQDEVAEAIKLCDIDSKDFILLLPEHIRKKLFIVNDTDGDIGDDEREDSALERERFDKDANGDEFNGTIRSSICLLKRNTSVANNNCKLGCEKS